jgi:hypothetical protein
MVEERSEREPRFEEERRPPRVPEEEFRRRQESRVREVRFEGWSKWKEKTPPSFWAKLCSKVEEEMLTEVRSNYL